MNGAASIRAVITGSCTAEKVYLRAEMHIYNTERGERMILVFQLTISGHQRDGRTDKRKIPQLIRCLCDRKVDWKQKKKINKKKK